MENNAIHIKEIYVEYKHTEIDMRIKAIQYTAHKGKDREVSD